MALGIEERKLEFCINPNCCGDRSEIDFLQYPFKVVYKFNKT